ncbi:TonB-dependent receptor [Oceanicoccus sp. KOV_DT_Chl]|uniref:TonB-dependent receptor n=1 Tax=Oceanicoccus sp. KOV_DT_Chl TaxID=1904639 RepID=UPI000C7AEEF6|nr:TonB-dependent receptor [Oceanicoccus sp. KOV_DT_Chl]
MAILLANSAAAELVIEEIMVTAQKRTESTQDIGAAISAVQGDSLERLNILDFTSVEQLTTGLTLDDSNARNTTISMRGVTYDSEGTANPTVDAYWNGVPVRNDAVFNQLFDISRIEVLRGPQGTLQGQTSPAGAIVIHSRKPNFEGNVEGYISTTVTENNGFSTQAAIDLPVVENTLAVRIAANYDDNDMDGIRNINTGSTQSSHSDAGRITIAWEPSDTLTTSLTHEYSEQELNDFKDMAGTDLLGNGNPDLDTYDRKGLNQLDATFDKRNRLTVLNVDWEVFGHQLTAISGYQDIHQFDSRDIDRANYSPLPQLQQVTTEYDIFSQELRLSSIDSGFWEYIVGGFYKDQNLSTNYLREIQPGAGFFFAAPDIPSNREETGVFTHNTFNLNEHSRLQLGLRWSKVRNFNRYDAVITDANGNVVNVRPPAIPDDKALTDQEEVTGSLKYLHHLDDDVMLYGSIDTSFRPGGVTVEPRITNPDDLIYDSETSISYELGFKSTVWDQRLQLNGSVYYQQFDDYINRIAGPLIDENLDGNPDSRASGVMANGDAVISGAEVDFTALLSEALSVGGGVNYTDAKYDGAEIPCSGNDGDYNQTSHIFLCDADGKNLGNEPNWTVTLNAEYQISLGSYDGFVRGLYKFTGSRNNDFQANSSVGGYGVVNLYAGISDPAEKWEVSLFAKNLLDKEAQINRSPNEVGAGAVDTGYRGVNIINEQTVGITARYNFGR